MGKPQTTESRTTTIRWPNEKIDSVESIAAEHGTNRHALIRLCVYYALDSGAIAELARSAPKVKAPI